MTTLLSTLALAVRVSLTSRVVGAASWAYSCMEMEHVGVGRRGEGEWGGEEGGRWRGGGGGDQEFLRARHDHFTYTPDGF